MEPDRFADEQAALRRVATLVARGASPAAVFATIAEEAGRLVRADVASVAAYDADGNPTVLATWSAAGEAEPVGQLLEVAAPIAVGDRL